MTYDDEIADSALRPGSTSEIESPSAAIDQLDLPVRAQQRFGLSGIAPIGPHAGPVAAEAKAEHEHRDDQRGGIDRVPEHVAELADPDDLVDQAAEPGAEEEEVDHRGKDYPEWGWDEIG